MCVGAGSDLRDCNGLERVGFVLSLRCVRTKRPKNHCPFWEGGSQNLSLCWRTVDISPSSILTAVFSLHSYSFWKGVSNIYLHSFIKEYFLQSFKVNKECVFLIFISLSDITLNIWTILPVTKVCVPQKWRNAPLNYSEHLIRARGRGGNWWYSNNSVGISIKWALSLSLSLPLSLSVSPSFLSFPTCHSHHPSFPHSPSLLSS